VATVSDTEDEICDAILREQVRAIEQALQAVVDKVAKDLGVEAPRVVLQGRFLPTSGVP
jgi:hypothetical protein